MSYKGVILVGGPSVGTRFRPMSMDQPKPLFPIAGHPIIYHPLSALAKVPGMKEILLIGFYDQSVFDRFLTESQIEFPFIQIRYNVFNPSYLREYQSMGTGGGIHHFRNEILRGNPDAFFVVNGDVASSFPFQDLLSAHKKSNAVATVLSQRMEKKDLNRYGCIVVDKATQRVEHFVEKPETFVSDIISCGIYIFKSDVFQHFNTAIEKRRILDQESGIDISQFAHKASLAASNAALSARSSDRVQMEQDLLPLLASQTILYAHVMGPKEFWMPIKAGSSCISANRRYLQYFLQAQPKRLSQPIGATPVRSTLSPVEAGTPSSRLFPEIISPVIIHPTAVIHPTAKIGPNAFIGPRVLIGRGVRVRDALILDGVEIKNESCILNAVVGWESKIGAWTRIEGSTSQEVDEFKDSATQKGFKIPSAAILGKGVTVSDEVIIRDCIVLPYKDLKNSFQREILM